MLRCHETELVEGLRLERRGLWVRFPPLVQTVLWVKKRRAEHWDLKFQTFEGSNPSKTTTYLNAIKANW